MSDYTKKEVELFGKKRFFRALSGIVINANQRSDTYVSGSGSSSYVGGYGGGKTAINSTVVVKSDIWIKSLSGKEYRLRFNRDIPVRDGNVIHAVDVLDTEGNQISDGEVLLYNSTTNEWFYTGGLNAKVRNIHPVSAILLVDWHKGTLAAANKQLGERFGKFYPELDEVAKKITPSAVNIAAVTTENQQAVTLTTNTNETAKAFCTSCGFKIDVTALFCGGCGTKLIPSA